MTAAWPLPSGWLTPLGVSPHALGRAVCQVTRPAHPTGPGGPGVLFYSDDLGTAAAYAALQRYARDHNIKITELSRALVDRAVSATLVLDRARTRGVIAG